MKLRYVLKWLEGPKYKMGTHVSAWGLLSTIDKRRFNWTYGVFTYRLKGGRSYIAEHFLVAYKKRERRPNEF